MDQEKLIIFFSGYKSPETSLIHKIELDNNFRIIQRDSFEYPSYLVQTEYEKLSEPSFFKIFLSENELYYLVPNSYQGEKVVFDFHSSKKRFGQIALDLNGYKFLGGDWWIDNDKIKIFGKYGDNKVPILVKGMFYVELDFLKLDDPQIKYFEFNENQVTQYTNSLIKSESLTKKLTIQKSILNFHSKSIHDFVDGSKMILSYDGFSYGNLILNNINKNGNIEWIKAINRSNNPMSELESKLFFIWSYGEKYALVHSGTVEDVDSKNIDLKKSNKISKNESVNLIEISSIGEIYREILSNSLIQTLR